MYKHDDLSELYSLVTEMMGGDMNAVVNWCNNPKDFLTGASPKDVWQTEDGQKKVVNFITNLSKGVFN